MIKAHLSGRMASSGISDVALTSVYSKNTRLKKLMMMIKIIIIIIIIISNMNKSQETMVFSGTRIDFRYETKARKVRVDF